jgi:hypothetical protein
VDDGRHWEFFRVGAGRVHFADSVRVAEVDEEGQGLAAAAARPVGALVINAWTPKDQQQDTTVLVSWAALAGLEGQLRVWVDMMPAHMRDQYHARADEFERVARDAG